MALAQCRQRLGVHARHAGAAVVSGREEAVPAVGEARAGEHLRRAHTSRGLERLQREAGGAHGVAGSPRRLGQSQHQLTPRRGIRHLAPFIDREGALVVTGGLLERQGLDRLFRGST